MHNAEAQISRTLNAFATDTPQKISTYTSTWANTHTNSAVDDVVGAQLAYKSILLDTEIAPRLATDKGLSTMTLRCFGIPANAGDEEIARQLTEVLSRADDVRDAIVKEADTTMPQRPGRALALPCPMATTDPWRGKTHWVDHAIDDMDHNRERLRKLRRVGRQHWVFILRALAEHADRSTGRNCYASNLTIGKTAARLCREHIDAGGLHRGIRTNALSERTLVDAVSAVVSALIELGFVTERARGRHLTRRERIVAFARHRIHQTKAASVRDLTLPKAHRKPPALAPRTPTGPAWVTPSNPFIAQQHCNALRKSLAHAVEMPLLRTHRHVVTLSTLLTVFSGYLTHARGPHPEKRPRSRGADRHQPSIDAKKTAADLLQFVPWALKNPHCPTRPRHINALAHVIDAVGAASMRGKTLYDLLNAEIRNRHLEVRIVEINNPLGWLHTMLTRVLSVSKA